MKALTSRVASAIRPWATAEVFYAALRVVVGAYAFASFAYFACAPFDTLLRGVLHNALHDREQRALSLVVAGGLAAAAAYVGFFVIRGRKEPSQPAKALVDASYEPFLLAPLGLWPLYEASPETHVRLLCIAAMGTLAGVAFYLFATRSPRGKVFDIPLPKSVERMLPFVIGAVGLLHAIWMATLAAQNYALLWSGWDMAIYSQVHWNITTTFVPWSTAYSGDSFNHYAIHFSPIYHLTSLIYRFHRSPATLIWIENISLGLGALPAYLLGRKLTGRAFVGVALAIGYLLNPCAHGLAAYDFHEIVFFAPLMLAVAWAVETEKPGRVIWPLVVLVLMIREDTPAYLAVYGVFLWLTGRKSLGFRIALVSGAYLVLVHAALMPLLRGGAPYIFDNRYAGLMRAGASKKSSVVETVVSNVPYALGYVLSSTDRLTFIIFVLLPVAFLPLASRRAAILLIPGFAFSLLSSFAAQYSIEFHYTAPILPFVYVTTAATLAWVEKWRPRKGVVLAAVTLVCTTLLAGKFGKSPVVNAAAFERVLKEREAIYGGTAPAIHAAAASIPKDDRCVHATGNLLPAVAERRYAYIAPWGMWCDWGLVDYAPNARHAPSTYAAERGWLLEVLRSPDFGIRYLDDRVVLVGKGEPRDKNAMLIERLERVPHPPAP